MCLISIIINILNLKLGIYQFFLSCMITNGKFDNWEKESTFTQDAKWPLKDARFKWLEDLWVEAPAHNLGSIDRMVQSSMTILKSCPRLSPLSCHNN
jgi:hypothetical protein